MSLRIPIHSRKTTDDNYSTQVIKDVRQKKDIASKINIAAILAENRAIVEETMREAARLTVLGAAQSI